MGEFAYKEQGGLPETREPPPHLTPFKPGASCKSSPDATFGKCVAAGSSGPHQLPLLSAFRVASPVVLSVANEPPLCHLLASTSRQVRVHPRPRGAQGGGARQAARRGGQARLLEAQPGQQDGLRALHRAHEPQVVGQARTAWLTAGSLLACRMGQPRSHSAPAECVGENAVLKSTAWADVLTAFLAGVQELREPCKLFAAHHRTVISLPNRDLAQAASCPAPALMWNYQPQCASNKDPCSIALITAGQNIVATHHNGLKHVGLHGEGNGRCKAARSATQHLGRGYARDTSAKGRVAPPSQCSGVH